MNSVLVLDYATWRSGGNDLSKPNVVGTGATCLWNEFDYQCCLGQFSIQLEPGLTKKSLYGKLIPKSTQIEIPSLTLKKDRISFSGDMQVRIYDTVLSNDAMCINDDPDTTPQEKIYKLKALFLKKGYEIEVINLPSIENKEENELNTIGFEEKNSIGHY